MFEGSSQSEAAETQLRDRPDNPVDPLIEDLQRKAFGYFETYINRENGLVADRSVAGSPCSIAAVGFALSSYPVAVSRGWISRQAALSLTAVALRFFRQAQLDPDIGAGHRGFFYHFLDMRSGRRVWNCELSFIDTALLLAGVIGAQRFFNGDAAPEREIRDLADAILDNVDWPWALRRKHMVALGWTPERGFQRRNWTGYSEAQLMYVIGLGSRTHALSETSYRAWLKTCEWLDDPAGDYVYAGPLFIHQYPQAWLDLRGVADELIDSRGIDYFENTRRAIAAQRTYCEANPGEFSGYGADVWGLSAGLGPGSRRVLKNGRRVSLASYAARGAPFGPDDGTLTPANTVSCLPFAPDETMRAMKHMLAAYPGVLIDGRLTEGFNPSVRGSGPEGWVAHSTVGIDQGLVVLSIENYRTGLIWKLMLGAPVVKRGLERAGFKALQQRAAKAHPSLSQN